MCGGVDLEYYLTSEWALSLMVRVSQMKLNLKRKGILSVCIYVCSIGEQLNPLFADSLPLQEKLPYALR